MPTCRSCDREIEWVENEKSGKVMPLDLDPVPGGNGNGDRVSHFSTCPDADAHRHR